MIQVSESTAFAFGITCAGLGMVEGTLVSWLPDSSTFQLGLGACIILAGSVAMTAEKLQAKKRKDREDPIIRQYPQETEQYHASRSV